MFRPSEFPKAAAEWFRGNAQMRKGMMAVTVFLMAVVGASFVARCELMARSMSEPSIIIRGRSNTGEPIMLDDFREAYWWLRDNTPEDARIMVRGCGHRMQQHVGCDTRSSYHVLL